MAFWAGAVDAMRRGLQKKLGDSSRVVLVDAGDQAQGTLLSNFNEGELVLRAMDKIGYDAMITGNHDYDYGPRDWLVDQVTPTSADKNPRGALEHALGQIKIPVVSANTYVAASIVDTKGSVVPVTSSCVPTSGTPTIDWRSAKRPSFLKPFVVKDLGGVRVALIGIDNVGTPLTTVQANVADLCFRDEVEAYVDARKELEGKADVFVAVMHDGDTDVMSDASTVVKNILAKGGADAVHAVIAGHTHFVNNVTVGDVPMIQSGSGLDRFGRIDLIFDKTTKKIDVTKTKVHAGVRLLFDSCDAAPPASADFCEAAGGKVTFEGEPVSPDATIAKMIADERARIAPLARRKLGDADAEITRDRINESPLANALTDQALRMSVGRSGAHPDIAMLNTGGLRDNFHPGEVLYEHLFGILPFNNHAVVVGPMTGDALLDVLKRSAQSCGAFGSIMQSGLRVRFERDCNRAGKTGLDTAARLLHVETVAGEVLLDVDKGITPNPSRTFSVVTLDFIAAGGDAFGALRSASPLDIGVLRDSVADMLAASPVHFAAATDGRWVATSPK
jgi:5'-nucleotidase